MQEQIVSKYVSIFNEHNAEKRRAAIADLFCEDCQYTDPHVSVRGHDALEGFVSGVRKQWPEAVFRLASAIDSHHAQARFTWNVSLDAKSEPVGIGFDVLTLEGERIRRVYGFIDKGPQQMMKAVVARYLSAWNERQPTKRRAILDAVFTADATYTDPLGSVRGIEAIDGFISAVQEQFAGVTFVLGAKLDAHHEQARFTWNAMAPGVPEPVAIGFDVVAFEGHRIRDVHGFLDRAPAGQRAAGGA